MLDLNKIHCGDCMDVMKDIGSDCVDCIVTSPPYWGLRNYEEVQQIGLEPTLEEYHKRLLEVTAECKRVLKKTGTMFWVHGDSYGGSGQGAQTGYAGYKRKRVNNTMKKAVSLSATPKCLTMQNYRLAMRMIDEQGWILRNILIWHKKNHMPSSVQDRFTNAYEPVFFFSKSKKYWFDLDAIREQYKGTGGEAGFGANALLQSRNKGAREHPAGKNPGDVFTLTSQPFPEAHFAVFPEKLIEPFIKAGCPAEVCKHCGFIRERITERTTMEIKRSDWGEKAGNRTAPSGTMVNPSTSKTIGWTDCACRDKNKYEPGIVLDPFMGAGTTAVVAKKLGRDYLGIELNQEYIKMARKRIAAIPTNLKNFTINNQKDI